MGATGGASGGEFQSMQNFDTFLQICTVDPYKHCLVFSKITFSILLS